MLNSPSVSPIRMSSSPSSSRSSSPEPNETLMTASPETAQLSHRVRIEILAPGCPEFLFYDDIEPEVGFHAALALDDDGEIEQRNVRLDYNCVKRYLAVTFTSPLHGGNLNCVF